MRPNFGKSVLAAPQCGYQCARIFSVVEKAIDVGRRSYLRHLLPQAICPSQVDFAWRPNLEFIVLPPAWQIYI